ncbi:MAG: TerB family tellurite resistance protein [Congregibacter sp.]|nr:TerB family tellurite resistance protein [Congregibacter sp.]
MLMTKLKTLFTKDAGAQTQEDRALELACAALMFEVARADFAIEEAEQQAVRALLMTEFALTPEEITTVTEKASEQVDAATCLFEFTRTLNDLASIEQKRALLAMMWRVAMADNELSRYEEHLIRKVADLLYVPHSDFIAAKQQAM